jgi:hypothetical protein
MHSTARAHTSIIKFIAQFRYDWRCRKTDVTVSFVRHIGMLTRCGLLPNQIIISLSSSLTCVVATSANELQYADENLRGNLCEFFDVEFKLVAHLVVIAPCSFNQQIHQVGFVAEARL